MSWLMTWREGILLIALGILVYLAGVLFGMARKLARVSSAPERDVLLTGLCAEVEALKARVELLEEGTPARPEGVGSAADPLYESAQKLIKQGVGVDEVAARLGLSHAEVDLIAVLHRDRGVSSL
jgi:hypothetical protein